MNTFIEVLNHVVSTPYLWQSLGIVTASSLFIAPLLYNGDYKTATKTVIVIGGYVFFASLLNYFHLTDAGFGAKEWLQPVMIFSFVFIAYVVGLFIGIGVNRYIKNKQIKK